MGETDQLAETIEEIWERSPAALDDGERRAIAEAMALVDGGKIRCADITDGRWTVNSWVKKALDLYFRSSQPTLEYEAGPLQFRDRFPLKGGLEQAQIRVAPPAVARYGSFFSPGVTLMSCYVHLGVWVGAGSLIDSWVSLGTCAQIGERVKILPSTSIVGSLYPIEARPAVIEDDCQIGSGCVVGPGTRIRRGAILAAGVNITSTTPVVDAIGPSAEPLGGEVPENAIVIPGSIAAPSSAPSVVGVAAALVIGYRNPGMTANQNLEMAARQFRLSM
ncbi:DapH/DapD/GlmU-related protein [Paenarthrobacter sp. NEAU-H11]|uniref:DapH/DapD/GlmU-related protein n=1 Tax=Paenarthrobacter sp. NEAU-H11 TaxID=3423924 RepID=UPI003D326DCC